MYFLVHCLVPDVRKLNSLAVFAKRTGMIILGGGLIKHHICNANLMVTMATSPPSTHPQSAMHKRCSLTLNFTLAPQSKLGGGGSQVQTQVGPFWVRLMPLMPLALGLELELLREMRAGSNIVSSKH